MQFAETLDPGLHRRLVDSLYVEAMVMADEARSYFDRQGDADRDSMALHARIGFSCESLKVTTRLMHVIAWLLTQRAWQRGEIGAAALTDPKYHLGAAAATDPDMMAAFPFAARALIEGSTDLYNRVMRLQAGMGMGLSETPPRHNPARALIDRLERAF